MFDLQAGNQSQDLGLGRYIKRCGRFVGDQQLGFQEKRRRDHGALRLPAGELMRIRPGDALRVR